MDKEDELDRKRILVVEDDFVLAREICNELSAHGASVVGPAPTVHYARLVIGKRRLDGAVLDIKLFGEDVYGLADELMRDGVPILFATAYDTDKIIGRFRSVETLQKPIDLEQLIARVSAFERKPSRVNTSALPPRREGDDTPLAPPRTSVRETAGDRWCRALAHSMRDGFRSA